MLTKKMERALNEQINAELYSAYIYLSMAAHFENKNFEGFAKWMEAQAQEEVGHAMRIYGYVNSRSGRVVLAKIDGPKTDWSSCLDAFSDALDHERAITGNINDLVELAYKEKDNASHQFLMWFVAEQVEEEESVGRIVEKLKLVGDSPSALFILDRELGNRPAE